MYKRQEIETVDAVTFSRTPRLNVEGTGADDGSNDNHQMAFGVGQMALLITTIDNTGFGFQTRKR